MRVEQTVWSPDSEWRPVPPADLLPDASLVLVFGAPALFEEDERMVAIREAFPNAHVAGCSTAGEIAGSRVMDGTLVVTALRFDHTRVTAAVTTMQVGESSRQAGRRLAASLDQTQLCHVLVLSDGLEVNGTDLVAGLGDELPAGVTVSGGLSADGPDFQSTRVMLDGPPRDGSVVAVGFHGDRLRVSCGSFGGWDPFGPERLITKSDGNVLYELGGQSALGLYKKYLGEHARELPSSALLFPLLVRLSPDDPGVVRTILSVDERKDCMVFAGDVPRGAYARLMKANFDRLIDGAAEAARVSLGQTARPAPEWALFISCVGRKLLLKQRTEEEVEAARDILGGRIPVAGFYSYGEISPRGASSGCDLHNQTMTITTFAEM